MAGMVRGSRWAVVQSIVESQSRLAAIGAPGGGGGGLAGAWGLGPVIRVEGSRLRWWPGADRICQNCSDIISHMLLEVPYSLLRPTQPSQPGL